MKNILISCLLLALVPSGYAAERILIVVTNHPAMGDTGVPTGYYLSEVAHPWHVFTEAGYKVDFASPRGGFAPMDPKSFDLSDSMNKTFWHTLAAVEGLVSTQDLAQVESSDYAAIFFAGGHGSMWDFPESEAVAHQLAAVYQQGGVVGAVCHGPAALVGVEVDGKPWVQGKRVASFTNQEERAVELTDVMPFLLETKLEELGAEFVPAANFQINVVVDGRLVTGQNPASAEKAAEAIVQLLKQ
jgi:putative intracellular protease/amidase